MLRPKQYVWTIALLCLASCGAPAPADAGPTEEIIATEMIGGQPEVTAVTELDYEELDLPERHYLVLRQALPFAEVNGFFGIESEALMLAATRAGVVATGPLSLLTYVWDGERGRAELAVALPVAEGTELAPYVTITLPESPALALEVRGSLDQLSPVHLALDHEVRRRRVLPLLPSVEEYVVGPLQTSNPDEFVTRIVYAYAKPAE